MTNKLNWLGGLLALQLLLAGGLFLFDRAGREAAAAQPLLALSPVEVDELRIHADGDEVTLRRVAGHWQLPGLAQLPANDGKVGDLLDTLAGLQGDWPVATTRASHQRFEVAENSFQRKLLLRGDGKDLGDLLLGTSPGFRKTHVRKGGDDAVYALAINTFDVPARALDWLDKTLLAADTITRIQGPDFELVKDGEQWVLAGDSAEVELDADKAAELARALASLRVTAPVTDLAPASAESVVTLQVEGDGRHTYRLWQADEERYVQRSDRDIAFTLSQYDYDQLAGVTRQSLLVKTEETTAP